MAGPRIRTDIIEVFVFRHSPDESPDRAAASAHHARFLQLRRATDPLVGSWQPVMGHVEPHESATEAALRELREETRYHPGRGLVGFWQLELVNMYFLAPQDSIVLGPCFAAEVEPFAEPVINQDHDAIRWVPLDQTHRLFLWPGQRKAIEQISLDILCPGSPASRPLRIDLEEKT